MTQLLGSRWSARAFVVLLAVPAERALGVEVPVRRRFSAVVTGGYLVPVEG